MVGPRPAGRPWTPAEEVQLRKLIASKIKVGLIARKLKRSPGAVYARISSLKKLPRDLSVQCAGLLAPFRAPSSIRASGDQRTQREGACADSFDTPESKLSCSRDITKIANIAMKLVGVAVPGTFDAFGRLRRVEQCVD
jgi:hypothetical protein